jgi:creatinine amidohydrolase/Fe(II)-dependent formamide hydrolase-like protein
MLHLHPDLVDMSLAQDDGLPPKAPQLQGDLFAGGVATLAIPFDKLTRRGVFGRPTLASAEKGRRVLEVTVAELRRLVVDVWGT